jgi:hypothetical protein
MIAPSASTQRLAEIVYHVTLRKQRSNTATTTTSLRSSKEQDDDAWAEQVAQQKRAKFLQVPAFLVTVVSNNQAPTVTTAAAEDDSMVDPYQPLAFVPPSDERQLEDVRVCHMIIYYSFVACLVYIYFAHLLLYHHHHVSYDWNSTLPHVPRCKMSCSVYTPKALPANGRPDRSFTHRPFETWCRLNRPIALWL